MKRKRKNKGRVDYATLVTKPGEYPNEDTQVRFFPSTETLRRGYGKVQKYSLLDEDKILKGMAIRLNHNNKILTGLVIIRSRTS